MLEMTKDKHVEPESHFRIENSGKYLCYSVTCDSLCAQHFSGTIYNRYAQNQNNGKPNKGYKQNSK
jgi:hypothetical protein